MNKYRVDISSTSVTPCGMTSIKYIGDDWEEARRVYAQTPVGISPWGIPNELYGVLLSVWNDEKRDYIIKCSKGF